MNLGSARSIPLGSMIPKAGNGRRRPADSMRTADRRQRMGQARTRGKVLALSLSPSGGASCGSNATRLEGRKQPPRVSSAAPGPDSSRSYPSMQTGLGPTPTTSFPLRCTIVTPACTAEDTSAAFGAALSSRRIRTAPSVANVAGFALLAPRGPSSGSFGAVYRGGKNGPMERSLHSPTSWTSLVRTAIAAARESLMRRAAPRWDDMRSTGKLKVSRAASTAAMRRCRGNTPPPSVGSRAKLSRQRPRWRLPLLRPPARGRQCLGTRWPLRRPGVRASCPAAAAATAAVLGSPLCWPESRRKKRWRGRLLPPLQLPPLLPAVSERPPPRC